MGITTAERFIFSLYLVYSLLIVLYVLMGWLQLPYSIWIGRIRGFLHDTVEPVLRPIRAVLPSFGGSRPEPARRPHRARSGAADSDRYPGWVPVAGRTGQ